MDIVCRKCGLASHHQAVDERTACPACGAVYAKVAAAARLAEERRAALAKKGVAGSGNEQGDASRPGKLNTLSSGMNSVVGRALAIWGRQTLPGKIIIVLIWLAVTLPIQLLYLDPPDRSNRPTRLPSCQGGFIAQCIERRGLDPRLEGDPRFDPLLRLCRKECQG